MSSSSSAAFVVSALSTLSALSTPSTTMYPTHAHAIVNVTDYSLAHVARAPPVHRKKSHNSWSVLVRESLMDEIDDIVTALEGGKKLNQRNKSLAVHLCNNHVYIGQM